jgi:hypothetical protein
VALAASGAMGTSMHRDLWKLIRLVLQLRNHMHFKSHPEKINLKPLMFINQFVFRHLCFGQKAVAKAIAFSPVFKTNNQFFTHRRGIDGSDRLSDGLPGILCNICCL